MYMDKVGVGLITCDRVDMYDVCQKSIKDDWYDEFVVALQQKASKELFVRGHSLVSGEFYVELRRRLGFVP